MSKQHWNKCDDCGKFIPYLDFDSGKAERKLLTPSSHFTREEYETLCKKCAKKAKASSMFYISRVNLGDRVVERINSGSNIEEVKAAVARINCGNVIAIRQATVSEAALIEAGNHVTFIRQAGINP